MLTYDQELPHAALPRRRWRSADQAVEALVVIAVATSAEAVANIAVLRLAAGVGPGIWGQQIVS